MPSRPSLARCASVALLALVLAGCGDEVDEVTEAGERRAEQARAAAVEAGLGDDVADFLALAARGDTATYRVRYPGPADGTELVVTSRPPDRRVEVVADGVTTEVRLVTGGQAFECTPATGEGGGEGGSDGAEPAEPAGDGRDVDLRCERTDALAEPPGAFSERALEELQDALADRADDYAFEVETAPVAGVEARCLVTRRREGRESPELGEQGTLCVSQEGALLLVDQGSDRLEALDYDTDVDESVFVRPDLAEDGRTEG
ncbi:MAG TPA: hypothetical protein VFU14_07415 [Acidimicrobiales bacterium]|nr:hypothetical protein [Acidimicrobiales bacterium]